MVSVQEKPPGKCSRRPCQNLDGDPQVHLQNEFLIIVTKLWSLSCLQRAYEVRQCAELMTGLAGRLVRLLGVCLRHWWAGQRDVNSFAHMSSSINNCNTIFNFVLRSAVMASFVPSPGFWWMRSYILNFSHLMMGPYSIQVWIYGHGRVSPQDLHVIFLYIMLMCTLLIDPPLTALGANTTQIRNLTTVKSRSRKFI